MLSQKPDFEATVKPLLAGMKNSEQALRFLKELNEFSHLFSAFSGEKREGAEPKKQDGASEDSRPAPSTTPPFSGQKEKEQPSPTIGIADDYIQKSLDAYFRARGT